MSNSRQIDYRQLRSDVVDLSRRQTMLREKLQSHLSETGRSLGNVAHDVGIHRSRLDRFMEAEQAMVGGAGLRRLATVLEAEELGKEIAELNEKIADRYIGLVNYHENVIKIVFDLLEALGSQPVEYTMAEFAAAFGDYEETVLGALMCSKDALSVLHAQPSLIHEILDQLLDDQFDKRLKKVRESLAQLRLAKVSEVERLVAALRPHYTDKGSMIRELGLPRGSFDRANLTRASEVQLDMFIGMLAKTVEAVDVSSKELEESRVVTNLVTPEKPSAPERPPPQPDRQPEAVDLFRGLAGGEYNGVPYVLTIDNFREIDGLPVEALLNSLKVSVRTTRGLLMLAAQLKGDEVRTRMQQPGIRREIEELYLALELVSTTHPNALLELFQRTREQWTSLFDQPSKGGGVAHG